MSEKDTVYEFVDHLNAADGMYAAKAARGAPILR